MTSSERARPPVRPEEGLRLSDREVVGTVCGGGYVRPMQSRQRQSLDEIFPL